MASLRFCPAVLLVALAGCASRPAGESPPRLCLESEELQQVVDDYFRLVSGPAGERIPDAFTELFAESARLDAIGVDESGRNAYFPQTLTEYIHHVDEYRRAQGFFQVPLSRTTTCHVRAASVDVWFESSNTGGGPIIDRGLISLHLLRSAGAWRIAHVQWNSTPG